MKSMDDPCPKCGRRQTEGLDDRFLRCNCCDYEWIRRSPSRPKKCPLCRSEEWDSPRRVRQVCQLCGHIWVCRGRPPVRCPRCRSSVWNMPPKAVRCQRCGHAWKMRARRSEDAVSSCPSCGSRRWNVPMSISLDIDSGRARYREILPRDGHRTLIICRGCGNRWYGGGTGGDGPCPACGRVCGLHDRRQSTSMILWSGDGRELSYVAENGNGCIYLWEGDVPVAARYSGEVLSEAGITMDDVLEAVNSGSDTKRWKDLADEMYAGRDGYLANVDYLMKRLLLDRGDATVLSLHFTGMGPEAISRKLGLEEDEVSRAFDRIMKAYSDSDILVDDTVFTIDPMKFY